MEAIDKINILNIITYTGTIFVSVYLFGLSLKELNKLNSSHQTRSNYMAKLINYAIFYIIW